MGACASVNTTPSRRIDVREHVVNKLTNCPKHWDNSVTHYNERNNDLYCLTCFQDYKQRKPRSEQDVVDVNKYVKTLQFRQTETNLFDRLQNNRRKAEHQLLQITQNKKAIENKKLQFVEEIKAFVKTIVDLLQHLGQDLSQEADSKVKAALEELDRVYIKVGKQLERTTSLSKDIETHRQSDNSAARVDTMIKCRNFFKQHNHSKTKHYEPSLRLHKSLTLNDIVGKGGPNNRVSLGTVTCDNRTERDTDTLSDISETSNETDNEFRTRDVNSRTPTNRTIHSRRDTTRSQNDSPTKRRGNTAMLVHGDANDYTSPVMTPASVRHTANGELNSDDNRESPRINVGRFSVTSTSQRKYYGDDSDRMSKNQSRSESRGAENMGKLSSNTRRSSMQQTPTPRRSVQSILSTGNISAALLATPRLDAYKESMERRLAEKLKVVTLPRDEHIHNITDTVVLDDEKIVLCDQKNEKLILLNDKQDIVHDIKVRGYPHNVTQVPGDICKVAVTIPVENVVKIIQVDVESFSDEIEVVKLQTKPKCRGIEYVDGNMLYTTKNDVAVLRKDDQRTWKFKYAFHQPVSLQADRNNKIVYISCYGTNSNSTGEVVKMKYADESIDFVLSHADIKHPVCTAVDAEGYIYVCDVDPPSIHQVNSKGEYCRRILSANDGKFQHVNFIPGSDVFIATENDSDCVQFYHMK